MIRRTLRSVCSRPYSSYVQGQTVQGLREYFYYVDHEGQLFLDDARIKNFTSCYKDLHFLTFFFARLKLNDIGRHGDFPYISPCAREMNFLHCDDRPFVFTSLNADEGLLTVNYSSKKIAFEADKLCMFPSGRVYHPSPFDNYGLVKSKLADQLYPNFVFDAQGSPIQFRWKGDTVQLSNELLRYYKGDN